MKAYKTVGVLVLVAAAAVLSGCSTANVAFRNFPTTTFAEIPLDAGATVRVAAREGSGEMAKAFAKLLSAELSRGEGLRLAKDGEKADYWFLVDGFMTSRSDTPRQACYNTACIKVREENEGGGHETIARHSQSSYTASCGMNIAVYRAEGLAPLHYVELPVYEGELGSGVDPDKGEETKVRLARLAVERVKDMFLTQQKTVSIPIPRDSDPELYNAFLKLDQATVAGDSAALADAISAIERRAADILPGSLETFGEELKTKAWKGREKEAEAILGNYHIRALAREAACMDPETLREIHAEQLRILELSTMDSLRMACPIALARLEYKINNL